jgi:DNA-directed RNA polymerase subunit RPC12/RpoP
MGTITLKGYKCERCGHTWVPVSEERPRVCPKCKSPYWDKPRSADWEKRVKAKLKDS